MARTLETPKVWTGATVVSVIALTLFALFFAGLSVAALWHHIGNRTAELTGIGAVMMLVLALYQVRMLRASRS